MPSNEAHLHFQGVNETQNFLGQDLDLTTNNEGDPQGAIRIRAEGYQSPGLYLPSDGWESVPGTSPGLEARMDGHYAVDYIRVRQA